MYIYIILNASANLKLESITHNYPSVGHTQYADDSMHSTIEKEIYRVKKSDLVYTPSQFVSIIQSAKKRRKPYKVQQLKIKRIKVFMHNKNSKDVTVNYTTRWQCET